MQAYYYSKTQGEERQILANQIVNKYDDYAEMGRFPLELQSKN
jgi:protein subunit release factor A